MHTIHSRLWYCGQVVTLAVMVVGLVASSLGLTGLIGINISKYIRIMIPVVFSR